MDRLTVPLLVVAGLLVGPVAPVLAQEVLPQATSVEALLTYPDYYQGRPVIVRGEVESDADRHRVRSEDGTRLLPVLRPDGSVASGLVDLRGQLWDIGRMQSDDPRFAGFDLTRLLGIDPNRWPQPGETLVFAVSGSLPSVRPAETALSIRQVALEPGRYEGRSATLQGQYRGRNLFGEVPRAPGISRWDFLIRSAGGAIWVTGMRPRGRGFQFALDSKLDTQRWLEARGVIRQGRGLVWMEAESLRLVDPVAETAEAPELAVALPAAPPPPPPEAVFSMPTEGETEVPTDTTVSIQFSRDLDPATLQKNIRIRYAGEAPPPDPIEFTYGYNEGLRALEIRFARPLARFRTVRIDLTEGILGTDKQPLKPWTLTFSLGG